MVNTIMKFFKQKTQAEKLQIKYEQLLKRSFELSIVNRKESDKVYVEAQEVMDEIESLQQK